LRCTGRTLRSEPSPHLAGEAALPSQYFNERHGTASVYRVWRSHPAFSGTSDSSPDGAASGSRRVISERPRPNSAQTAAEIRAVPIIAATSCGPAAKPARFSPSQPCLAGHPRLLTPEPQGPCSLLGAFRRGGRVVECTALEMRHRCKPIGGSNPSLSANIIRHNKTAFQKARQISLILPALAPPAPSAPSPRTPARPATASDPGAAAATPGG
jgi:hypothetical protein